MHEKSKSRWLQFSLGTLFAVVTACAVASSTKRWLYVACGVFVFGFWRSAYHEENPRLGFLVLIGLYLAVCCIAIAFSR